jgi:hypothetical protein
MLPDVPFDVPPDVVPPDVLLEVPLVVPEVPPVELEVGVLAWAVSTPQATRKEKRDTSANVLVMHPDYAWVMPT